MKEWLRTTLARLIIVGIVLGAGVFLFVWLPSHQARDAIKGQLEAGNRAQDTVQTAVMLLGSSPSVEQVPLSQPHSFSGYAEQVKQLNVKLSKLSINKIVSKRISAPNAFNSHQIVKDTNAAIESTNNIYTMINNDINDAKELSSYNAVISKTLVNIMEYNASADTANFSLGTADTEKRLDLAAEGIAKTNNELRQAKGKYSDVTLKELLSIVSGLQVSRQRLAKDGNTQSWISNVNTAQLKIASNRQAFWRDSSSSITSKFQTDLEGLEKSQNLWQQLKIKYRV